MSKYILETRFMTTTFFKGQVLGLYLYHCWCQRCQFSPATEEKEKIEAKQGNIYLQQRERNDDRTLKVWQECGWRNMGDAWSKTCPLLWGTWRPISGAPERQRRLLLPQCLHLSSLSAPLLHLLLTHLLCRVSTGRSTKGSAFWMLHGQGLEGSLLCTVSRSRMLRNELRRESTARENSLSDNQTRKKLAEFELKKVMLFIFDTFHDLVLLLPVSILIFPVFECFLFDLSEVNVLQKNKHFLFFRVLGHPEESEVRRNIREIQENFQGVNQLGIIKSF